MTPTPQQAWPAATAAAAAAGLSVIFQSDPVDVSNDNYALLCNKAGYQFAIWAETFPHNVGDNNFWASSGGYSSDLSIDGSGNITAHPRSDFNHNAIISHLFCSNNASAQLPSTCPATTLNGLALPASLVLRSPASFAARKSTPVPGFEEFYGWNFPQRDSQGYAYQCDYNSSAWFQVAPDCAPTTVQAPGVDANGNPTSTTVTLPIGYTGDGNSGYACNVGSPGWTLIPPPVDNSGNGGN